MNEGLVVWGLTHVRVPPLARSHGAAARAAAIQPLAAAITGARGGVVSKASDGTSSRAIRGAIGRSEQGRWLTCPKKSLAELGRALLECPVRRVDPAGEWTVPPAQREDALDRAPADRCRASMPGPAGAGSVLASPVRWAQDAGMPWSWNPGMYRRPSVRALASLCGGETGGGRSEPAAGMVAWPRPARPGGSRAPPKVPGAGIRDVSSNARRRRAKARVGASASVR